MRRWRPGLLALCAAAIASAGCLTTALIVGAGVAGAIYFTADESATFQAPVPEVHAATLIALERLELTVTSSTREGESATIKGIASGGRDLTIEIAKEGTTMSKVGVRVGLSGDVEESQAILSEIRDVLGSRDA